RLPLLDLGEPRRVLQLPESAPCLLVTLERGAVPSRELVDEAHLARGDGGGLVVPELTAALERRPVPVEGSGVVRLLEGHVPQALERPYPPRLVTGALMLGQRLPLVGVGVCVLPQEVVDLTDALVELRQEARVS